MRYSFTGTTKIPAGGHAIIGEILRELEEPLEVYTGGALGVDTVVCSVTLEIWPKAVHALCLPVGVPHNGDKLPRQLPRLLASQGDTASESYMNRNDLLVNCCDELIAFPVTAEEITRSGTWATVRRARKAGKPVHIFPLS